PENANCLKSEVRKLKQDSTLRRSLQRLSKTLEQPDNPTLEAVKQETGADVEFSTARWIRQLREA
ncbi:MAG: hypothetical protein L6R36_008964, partial [Xanthoria steineri]